MSSPAYWTGIRLELGPPEAPLEVTGTALAGTIRRGLTAAGAANVLEPGTLVLTVRDPSLNPQTNPAARKGRPVRVLVAAAGSWVPVVTGTLSKALLVYPKTPRGSLEEGYDLVLEAEDVVPTLAATPAASTITGTLAQRVAHLLAGTALEYEVTDTTPPALAPRTLPLEGATVLDQLTTARDTAHGTLFVDRGNRVRGYGDRDRPQAGDPVTVTFTDDPAAPAGPTVIHYTGLSPEYDTTELVNVVRAMHAGAEEEAAEVHSFPASVAEWGPVAEEVTVTDGNLAGHAYRRMGGRKEPRLGIKSLTYNATADPALAAAVEVCDPVHVRRAGLVDEPYEVLGLEHSFTATRWHVTVHLRHLEVLPLRWADFPADFTWADFPPELTWGDLAVWRPPATP